MTLARIGFAADLASYAEKHGSITVGVAGIGQMGTDLVVSLARIAGMRIGAVFENRPGQVVEAVLMAGHEAGHAVSASQPNAIDAAIEQGKIAITDDYLSLCRAGRIDVIIDATGNPNVGAIIALEAMRNGKPIVMLNVEADITIGRYLKEEARKAGTVYTGAAGDEPFCTLELIAFAQSIGLEVIAAGKGKNNALKFDATPEEFTEEALARNMNPRVLVEFVDGSKTMVEMTAIANASGLVPDVPGMHGPEATLDTLADVLCTKEDGGLLSKAGCVDYTIGKGVAPGVFCIVKPPHPRMLERMIDLKVGKGPCFALVRPFHLTSLETPLSAARAVMYRKADMQPLDRPVAECVAVAKRDMKPGEILGRIGQADYRGWAMTWAQARRDRNLPLGLAEKAKVIRPIKKGEALTYENCKTDDTLVVTRLRAMLDDRDAGHAM